jgi:PAS domain S-box-containing protein
MTEITDFNFAEDDFTAADLANFKLIKSEEEADLNNLAGLLNQMVAAKVAKLSQEKDEFYSKQLASKELESDTFYNHSPCGYFSTAGNGIINKINDTLLVWLGYAKEEIIGKVTWQSLLSVGGKMYFETHYSPLLQMQGFVQEISFEMVKKDKTRLPILINTKQIRDENGNVQINYSTVFDVSQRKSYENELLIAKRTAEDQNKLIYEINEKLLVSEEELKSTIEEIERLNENLNELVEYTFKNASIPIYFILEDASIYDFNDIAAENLGYTSEELQTLKIYDLDEDYDEKKWASVWAKLKAQKKITVETQQKKKDGTLIDVIITANYVKYGDLELNCSFVLDITEKRKQEEEIKNKEQQLNLIYNNVSDCIFMLGIEDENRFKFISVNSTFLTTTGLNEEQIIGQYVQNVIPMPSLQMALEKYIEAITTRSSISWEEISVYPSGTKTGFVTVSPIIDEKNNCTMLVGSVHDITEKKKQEQQLQLLDYSYKHTDSAMFFLDADGLYIDFNRATANMLGYSYEEFRGKTAMDVNPLMTKESWVKRWEELKITPNQNFAVKSKRKDGTFIDVAVTTNSIEINGKIVNFGFYEDITQKKKVAEELKLMDFAFKKSATPIMLLLPTGEFYNFNDALLNLLGYTYEEFSEMNLLDVATTMNEASCIKQWDEIREKKNTVFGCHFERKDGTLLNVEVSSNLITYNEYEVNFCYINDITERKKAEERLRLMESVILNTKDSIMITEAEPFDEPGPRIIFVNPAFEKMTGYTPEEVIGLTPRLLQGPKSDKTELKRLSEAIRSWETCEITTINYKKNGEEFWINFSVSPVANEKGWFTHWIAVERDITERKRAEEELKKSNEFSKGVLNSLNSYIAVLNKTGEIIKTNQAWKIMSASAEMSMANFISEGKNFLDILDKAAAAGNMVAKDTIVGLRDIMNERTSIYKNQYYFKPTASSDKWWFDIVISGFQSQSDLVIINIQDITDLKNTEKERDNTQEANTQLQKIELKLSNALAKEKDLNELKSRFVTMASHEFRTPLTTIMSSLSLISRYAENADTEGQVKHINKIKISVNNLTDILTDFLSVSKLEEGKIVNNPEEINLKNFIEDIISEMQSTITERITIAEKYHAKEMAIFDQKLLKNIMFNLLSNAIKFSKASGIIEVVIEELEDSIVIAVKDNGIGISKEDQKNLFQRFFRGYNATHIQGTGLGLNIVAKYAEVMKASLTYESIENKGSIFSLKIPQ